MRRKILMLLLAAVCLFSTGMVLRQQMQYRQIAADSAEAAELAGLTDPVQPAPSAPARSDALEGPVLPDEVAALAEIDLSALQAVNGDVVGWLAIPGTELSYPLVQGTDNRYYLNHSWKQEYCAGGSVFLESTDSPAFDGFHTIAYGHRMRDGSMFGSLKHYSGTDYWRAHPSVYVVTEGAVLRYDIFSAQNAGVTSLVFRLDLEQGHLEEEFLRYCAEGSVLDTGIVPEADDRILTLSTCTGRGYGDRWVVHAVFSEKYSREKTA